MKKISVSALCRTGVIAAIYFCISVVFAPISFGAVQVRVSEALTILPTLSPLGIYGVTIGCLLTNIYGISTGANVLGAADVFFGTMATFVSALLTYKLRNVNFKGFPLLSTLPPIIINAAVVGAELSFALMGSAFDS
ncbi:MAG: QueT transporter family protein, partial [Oscillospiraceae bacterium]